MSGRGMLSGPLPPPPLPPPPETPKVDPKPSWWGQLRGGAKLGVWAFGILVGTGGCGGILTGTALVIGALKPDTKPVKDELAKMNEHLESLRATDQEHEIRLRVAERELEQLGKKLAHRDKLHETQVRSYQKQLRGQR